VYSSNIEEDKRRPLIMEKKHFEKGERKIYLSYSTKSIEKLLLVF